MKNDEYGEVCAEVLEILKHIDIEDYKKIPNKFIKFLTIKQSKDYIVNIDYSKSLGEMNLRNKTKAMLAIIYNRYICDEQEKKELDKILKNTEKK